MGALIWRATYSVYIGPVPLELKPMQNRPEVREAPFWRDPLILSYSTAKHDPDGCGQKSDMAQFVHIQ